MSEEGKKKAFADKAVILDAVIIREDLQEKSNGSALMSSEGERMAKKKVNVQLPQM